MVHCRHCTVTNTLDSAYCRKCGVILLEVDVEEAQQKLNTLVAEGNIAFSEGRNDEALAIAEKAIESNPSMVSALSLASDVYSRKGDLATALDFSDRVVELNPTSDLDRIRRNQLRARLQDEIRVAETPDRKNALLAAAAAVVLVVSIGAIATKMMNPTPTERPVQVASNQTVTPQTNTNVGTNPSTNTNQPTTPPVNQGNGQPTGETGINPGTNDTSEEPPPVRNRFPRGGYSGGGLPPVGEGGSVEINPLDPGRPPTGPKKEGDDPDPKRDDPKPPVVKPSTEFVENPGEITISIRKGPSAPRNGVAGGSVGTDPEPVSGTGVQALIRAGSQQFQAGSLSNAATTYERALSAGADPISINQRLGMIYERLGRNGEAVNAYNRVIQSAQAALTSGTGNSSRVQSALDTAKQAVKALGG